jgi:23S rRNA (guanosine2251-2'-O)-methyltransferase
MQRQITGYHAAHEHLAGGKAEGVLYVSAATGRPGQLVKLARAAGLRVETVSHPELLRMAPHSRGFVLQLTDAPASKTRDLRASLGEMQDATALVLLLDGVTDPHNFGAVLRSADQFAVDLVVTPQRRSARLSDTVARTSAGADRHVTVVTVANLVRAVQLLQEREFWVYAADMDGDRIDSVDLRGRVGLVLGAEGSGVSRLVRGRCDGAVAVPLRGHVDSLNVSVAAGICMYEIRRQQWPPS